MRPVKVTLEEFLLVGDAGGPVNWEPDDEPSRHYPIRGGAKWESEKEWILGTNNPKRVYYVFVED